jgi:hypothetical protein
MRIVRRTDYEREEMPWSSAAKDDLLMYAFLYLAAAPTSFAIMRTGAGDRPAAYDGANSAGLRPGHG